MRDTQPNPQAGDEPKPVHTIDEYRQMRQRSLNADPSLDEVYRQRLALLGVDIDAPAGQAPTGEQAAQQGDEQIVA